MSLESDIKSALDSLVSNRVSPDVPPDNPVFPCIVFQQVGGDAVNFLECTVPDKNHARVQIRVWASTRLSSSSLAQQARAALVTALDAYVYGAPISEYESALKLYGSRFDVGIWYTP